MAINDSCNVKQTFCNLNKQTINSIEELQFSYNTTLSNNLISDDIWNQIIEKIIQIYNYGTRGTRNPIKPLNITIFQDIVDTHSGNETKDSSIISDTEKNKKKKLKNDLISLNEYNEILNSINISSITNLNTLILKDDFENIKNAINNLQLNSTRCNNCNTDCNTTCQAVSQCYCDCYCDCYSSGGGDSHQACAPCSICYSA